MRSKSKTGHQIKALFIKNLQIQKRQPCNNCCQILTPIICLILTIIIRNAAISNITTQNDTIYGLFPLFAIKFNDYQLIDQLPDFVHRECQQWYLFDYENPKDQVFIGERYGVDRKAGMLGFIESTSPYWQSFNTSLEQPYNIDQRIPPSFMQTNKSIDQQLFARYELLNNDNLDSILKTTANQHLPSGAIHFKAADSDELNAVLRVKDIRQFFFYRSDAISRVDMNINFGNASFSPTFIIPQGFLNIMDMITQAYIRQRTGITVVSGYTYMPYLGTSSFFIQMLINTVCTIIFPLSLSLLMPVFLYLIVLQKQQKLIQMMRMNGMSIFNYWTINFLYNFVISLVTNGIFFLFGYLYLDMSFFHHTSHLLIAIVLLGWILAQIGMSMFLQVFISASRAANIIGYLVSIWTSLIGSTLSVALFQFPNQLPLSYSLWPTFSFNRLFYLMFSYCSLDRCIQNFDGITSQMWRCIIILYGSFVMFSLIGMYLFQVVPQQYGVTKPILFPLLLLKDLLIKRKNYVSTKNQKEEQTKNDASIDQQKQFIESIQDLQKYPLVCDRLSETYDNGKLAVNQFSLAIEDNTIFGLLGPNGAGKTTLLSMITGIFSPTSGNAFVGGYSILNQMDKVHLQMGVCPQFDIVWPSLTVEQHLYFYARLRGVSSKDEKQKVQETLQEVNLTDQRFYKVTQLSGGMKRRLSIGISLVGDPRIVFMDEPTTGLDPQNRRHLWQVLAKCRDKRSLFLTTHMMEQAEALCDKIGIITNGCIRTVGDQFKLKQVYGKGYFISIGVQLQKQIDHQSIQIEDERYQGLSISSSVFNFKSIMTENPLDQANKYITKLQKMSSFKQKVLHLFYPATITKQISGFIKINVQAAKVSEILQNLRVLRKQHISFEWAISDSTLEDVFLQVISRFDTLQKPSLLDSVNIE